MPLTQKGSVKLEPLRRKSSEKLPAADSVKKSDAKQPTVNKGPMPSVKEPLTAGQEDQKLHGHAFSNQKKKASKENGQKANENKDSAGVGLKISMAAKHSSKLEPVCTGFSATNLDLETNFNQRKGMGSASDLTGGNEIQTAAVIHSSEEIKDDFNDIIRPQVDRKAGSGHRMTRSTSTPIGGGKNSGYSYNLTECRRFYDGIINRERQHQRRLVQSAFDREGSSRVAAEDAHKLSHSFGGLSLTQIKDSARRREESADSAVSGSQAGGRRHSNDCQWSFQDCPDDPDLIFDEDKGCYVRLDLLNDYIHDLEVWRRDSTASNRSRDKSSVGSNDSGYMSPHGCPSQKHSAASSSSSSSQRSSFASSSSSTFKFSSAPQSQSVLSTPSASQRHSVPGNTSSGRRSSNGKTYPKNDNGSSEGCPAKDEKTMSSPAATLTSQKKISNRVKRSKSHSHSLTSALGPKNTRDLADVDCDTIQAQRYLFEATAGGSACSTEVDVHDEPNTLVQKEESSKAGNDGGSSSTEKSTNPIPAKLRQPSMTREMEKLRKWQVRAKSLDAGKLANPTDGQLTTPRTEVDHVNGRHEEDETVDEKAEGPLSSLDSSKTRRRHKRSMTRTYSVPGADGGFDLKPGRGPSPKFDWKEMEGLTALHHEIVYINTSASPNVEPEPRHDDEGQAKPVKKQPSDEVVDTRPRRKLSVCYVGHPNNMKH